jgi:FkbM family methyltransferase
MLWRARWAMQQLLDARGYARHACVLASPVDFYIALLRELAVERSRGQRSLVLKTGHRIPVAGFMSLFIYKEIFVDGCYDVQLGRDDPVVVDVGANTGLFALRIKQLYPRATVLCFEPFEDNFDELRRTLQLNGLADGSVSCLRKAVGSREGSAKLYVHKHNIGGHSLFPDLADSTESVDVQVISIASILETLPRLDLLKLDCEGAEFDILTSLRHEHAAMIGRMIVEMTPRLYHPSELMRRMEGLGFDYLWRNGLYEFVRHVGVSEGNRGPPPDDVR